MLLNELRVWLPYNLLAYAFVPAAVRVRGASQPEWRLHMHGHRHTPCKRTRKHGAQVRPTTTALLTFGWQTYISWVAHRDRLGGGLAQAELELVSSADGGVDKQRVSGGAG